MDTSPPYPLSVLVVDDDPDTADSTAELLALCGHRPRVARCGPDALRLTDELDPDVILLDIGLPGMNGWEVARHLRHRRSTALLVAVSGYGQDDDRRRSAEVGIHLHLVKPVEPATLELALLQWDLHKTLADRRSVATLEMKGVRAEGADGSNGITKPYMWDAEQLLKWMSAWYHEPRIDLKDGRWWATIPPVPGRATVGCGSHSMNAVYDLYCELVPLRYRRPVKGLVFEGWEMRRRVHLDSERSDDL